MATLSAVDMENAARALEDSARVARAKGHMYTAESQYLLAAKFREQASRKLRNPSDKAHNAAMADHARRMAIYVSVQIDSAQA